MSQDHLIYCHTNLLNNYKYIGQTSGDPIQRWGKDGKGYLKSKKLNKRGFGQAILDYGWDNFSHEILEEGLTQEEANEREQYWIKYYNTWIGGNDNAQGYNLSKGGGHIESYNHIEKPERVGTSISKDEYDKLEEIGRKEDRPISWLVRKAIQEYLDKQEK